MQLTELFNVVVLEGCLSITFEPRSIFLGGTWFSAWLASLFTEVIPSSAFWTPPTMKGSKFWWILVMPDSIGPDERLNSRSIGCNSRVFIEVELATLLELGVLSFPMCRVKSNSRSIEDSSSFSFADDIVV